MTEAEWLCCSDPKAMLAFLRDSGIGSERKLRSFAVACASRVQAHLRDERSCEAIRVVGRIAAGDVPRSELGTARAAALAAWSEMLWERADNLLIGAARAAESVALEDAFSAALETAERAEVATAMSAWSSGPHYGLSCSDELLQSLGVPERNWQSSLLREFVGNPFRPVALNPAWLAWQCATIPKLAQSIYDDSAFDRLPVLADALEEAGCDDAEVLSHCRGGGEHARGCWVLDLLLNRAQSGRKA